jgi:hypothetical protein
MLPLETDAVGVSRFILTASVDSCHFGAVGQINEWVLVSVAGGRRVPFPKARLITVFGRLEVKPEWRGSALTSLYRMSAEMIAIH